MLDKNKLKILSSLQIKKYRDKYSLFTAEREKNVFDLVNSGAKLKYLLYVSDNFNPLLKKYSENEIRCTEWELKKISALKSVPDLIGVFSYNDNLINYGELSSGLSIFCDDIQNPGNFGTIIRTADWFGIKNIVCSQNTVDKYNPKVVQATAGSLFRLNIVYVDKIEFFNKANSLKLSIYGTFLEGKSVYDENLTQNGIIVLGNEGQGISLEVEKFVTNKLYIQGWPEINPEAESLNVSIAASIIMSEFRRRK